MRLLVGVVFIVSGLAWADSKLPIDPTDVRNTLREDAAEARGRKEAAIAMVAFRDAKLRRTQHLYTKSAVSMSSLDLAVAEKAAAEFLVGALAAEEEIQGIRLKIFNHQTQPKVDPKVIADLAKQRESARCVKARHRRDYSGAFAIYHGREVHRNEILLRKGAVALEDYQQSVAKLQEAQQLEKSWKEFLADCGA